MRITIQDKVTEILANKKKTRDNDFYVLYLHTKGVVGKSTKKNDKTTLVTEESKEEEEEIVEIIESTSEDDILSVVIQFEEENFTATGFPAHLGF